jgi:HSP20 family molecular chaperone IbpA
MTGIREFGQSAANAVLERMGRGISRVQERRPLPTDLLESDDAYLVVFDAPGTARSDVQVRFVDGRVQVRIDRFREFYEGFEMRFPGRGLALDGEVDLPDDADVDAGAANATLSDNGTLKVRIPKTARGRNVVVEDEDEAEADHDDGGVAVGTGESGDDGDHAPADGGTTDGDGDDEDDA